MNKWLGAVAIVLLGACTKEPVENIREPQTVTRTLLIEAAVPGTRTELAPDGFNVLWSPGDTIGVYVKSGDTFTTLNAPLTFEGAVPAASGRFKGDISIAEGASGYTLYAYYPYAAQSSPDARAVPFTLAVEQEQPAAGVSTHLGNYDFLVAGAVTSPTAVFTSLSFRHAFAVVEADLTGAGIMAGKSVESVTLYTTDASTVGADGSLADMANVAGAFSFDLTSGASNNTATYKGGFAQIDFARLAFGTDPVLGATPLKAYFTINPADYSRANGRVYIVVRTTDGYTATYSRPGLVISAAQMKVITQNIATGTAPQPPVDLSASETANCYVASLPSQEYSFNATTAGNGVVTPGLLTTVLRYEGRVLNTGLVGNTARLLWQSNAHLIDPASITYSGGRINFTLTSRPTVLGGNAVIALYASPDPAAEAVWSWHIWITDKSNAELTAVAEPYILFGDYEDLYGRGSVQMMDRNLGAVYKEDGPYARSFRAPLYQWGRKDPLPWGRVAFDAQDVPYTYLLNRPPVVSSGALGQYSGYTGNTYYATAHPETFITTTNATSFDWYYGAGAGNGPNFRNNELWGNPLGYQVGQKTTKTLFDPCPPGWVVPHPYAFSGFTKSGNTAPANDIDASISGTFVQGWNFYYSVSQTTFYPGVGFRYDEFGLFDFKPSAYYWTSSPTTDASFGGMYFGMTSQYIYQRVSDPRGFGLPIRCMRDINP